VDNQTIKRVEPQSQQARDGAATWFVILARRAISGETKQASRGTQRVSRVPETLTAAVLGVLGRVRPAAT
jgi:hypothetical protein